MLSLDHNLRYAMFYNYNIFQYNYLSSFLNTYPVGYSTKSVFQNSKIDFDEFNYHVTQLRLKQFDSKTCLNFYDDVRKELTTITRELDKSTRGEHIVVETDTDKSAVFFHNMNLVRNTFIEKLSPYQSNKKRNVIKFTENPIHNRELSNFCYSGITFNHNNITYTGILSLVYRNEIASMHKYIDPESFLKYISTLQHYEFRSFNTLADTIYKDFIKKVGELELGITLHVPQDSALTFYVRGNSINTIPLQVVHVGNLIQV
jgi:hypothetical protein